MLKDDFCPRIDGICPHKAITNKSTCFIVMAYDQLHSNKIEKMLTNAAKKVFKSNPILAKNIRHTQSTDLYCTKVCRPIKQATQCLVDLTYNSTNVGLEYAVAQNFNKPVIITKYIPKHIPNVNRTDKHKLNKLKNDGAIQYLEMPYHPPDFASLYRVEYANQKELISKLKLEFQIKSKK